MRQALASLAATSGFFRYFEIARLRAGLSSVMSLPNFTNEATRTRLLRQTSVI